MLRQGPVSAFVHGAVEYLVAAVLIMAPFLFGFDSNAARALSLVLGIVLLVVTASSELPTGLSKSIPVKIHVVLDLAVAAFLIAAPFLFNFQDEGAPTAFFLILGVAFLLLAIATRYLPPREVSESTARRLSGP
jgi:peptidoglycan/LPS O-acetylase OafA/YrhL